MRNDLKTQHSASNFENAVENVQPFYHQVKPAASYPVKVNDSKGPPYANTYFSAYQEKVISSEMQSHKEPSNDDYLRDVPKQSAYNPIRYPTYHQQNARQADYVIGVSYLK